MALPSYELLRNVMMFARLAVMSGFAAFEVSFKAYLNQNAEKKTTTSASAFIMSA